MEDSQIKITDGRVERIDEICSSLAAMSKQENFQDVRMVCQDGEVRGARLVLALAFPHMEEVMEEREEEELVLILPHMQVVEVTNRLKDFLKYTPKVEVKEEVGSDEEAEVDEVIFDSIDEQQQVNEETLSLKEVNAKLEIKLKEEDIEGIFEVERVIGKRMVHGFDEYLVKWKGYENEEDNTWEKRDNLVCAGEKIKEFNNSLKEKTKHRSKKMERRVEERESGWVRTETCHLCGVGSSGTKYHYVTTHIVSSLHVHPCPQCWEWFATEDDMENHLVYHKVTNKQTNKQNKKQLNCPICNYTCRAQNTAKLLHNRMNESNTPVGQLTMNEHVATHNGEVQKCDACGKEFKHFRGLDEHMKNVHEEPTHVCETCGEKFRYAYLVVDHVMTKHSLELNFSCDKCEKRFPSKSKLLGHQRRTHPDGRKHVCDGCGKAFKTKKCCEKHFKLVHTDERPLACSFEGCPQRFLSNTQKKMHERVHTGEKPYECDICGSSYRLIKYLTKHRMTHTGERPHVCQFCGKGFIQSCNMKSHQAKCKDGGNF